MTAAVLAQDQVGAGQPHGFRAHDFVRGPVPQHAMLMDAGLVGEGILAHDGLVARRVHSGDIGDDAARRIEPGGVDAGGHPEIALASLDRHDDFFQRTVARPFADTVDGALHLAGACVHRSQAVGDRHSEVVVTVCAQSDVLDPANVGDQILEDLRKLFGHCIAHGVRNVHGRGPGLYHGLDHLGQVFQFRARGVLGRELDVVAIVPGVRHRLHCALENFRLGHLQLVLAVDPAGGHEHVNSRTGRILYRVPHPLDILGIAARQTADGRAFDGPGDGLDGLEVSG